MEVMIISNQTRFLSIILVMTFLSGSLLIGPMISAIPQNTTPGTLTDPALNPQGHIAIITDEPETAVQKLMELLSKDKVI